MKLAPDYYPTTLYGSREPDLSADAWAYGGCRTLEVYVQVLRDDEHVVTIRFRVPVQTKKGKKK